MTKDHILEIRNFYMKLLDSPNLRDSIFHQAHCEEMVALCNYAARPEARARNAALEEAANACENIYAGDEAPGDWPTPEQCAAAIRKLKLSTPRTPRDSALDEIEKLIAAIEGRHFAAIGTAASEDDKRRHGTKAAFAMELRAAIRALKSEPPMNSGSK